MTLAYAAAFTAAAMLITNRRRRALLTITFLASATLHVLISIAMTGTSSRLHGAFVNSNHFAGYLEIAAAFAFGVIWSEVLTSSDRVKGVGDRGERLERRILPFLWRVGVWSILIIGITLTRSRGGLLAAAAMMAALLMLAFFNRRTSSARRSIAIAVVGVMLAGTLAVLLTVGQHTLNRVLSTDIVEARYDFRVAVWQSSIDAWKLFPHFGSGLGTFRDAFRRVQPREITGLVEHAHNDFLQLLVTGGWIGAALGVTIFVSIGTALVRAWLKQPHREESAFALAGIGALIALLVHGLVEFNMSMPAIPATLAIMLGASLSAANYRTER